MVDETIGGTPGEYYRQISPGMGEAVAARTILRKKADGSLENWGDVSDRVARGNALLSPLGAENIEAEYETLRKHLRNGTTLMSGRHLQHGDADQPNRNLEIYSNCATAATSFLLFYLLLNGSGVGRDYSDDMLLADYNNAPTLICVLDPTHPDFDHHIHESSRDARHKYGSGKDILWHTVGDSREGWSRALEIFELAAFQKIHANKMLILDFSKVRAKGAPIAGMQNRPASGPTALIGAFSKAATLKGAGIDRWKQSLYLDHYFSEAVLIGGARRAARMSLKFWKDQSVLDFITVKRPIEYDGMSGDEIISLRRSSSFPPMPFLWSSNNSVGVDTEFWDLVNSNSDEPMALHAKKVFNLACEASYADGTGEPGFVNLSSLVQNDTGWNDLNRGDYVGSSKYQVEEDTQIYLSKLAKRAKKKKFHTIINPCSEIPLNVLGGVCVIADVVPYHAETLKEAEDAFRVVTRALIRVNLMESIYSKEVKRTNRIGVGMTGIHEFAWKFFGFGFHDLLDENKSKAFWLTLARFNRAVHDEAVSYAKELGVAVPHTMTTIKPAGTTSKLFGLTEGWHLPSMREFLRWVQFRYDDPLILGYRDANYPVRELKSYSGTTIVGFPTAPEITKLGMGDKLVTAPEASPSDQYQWLKLGERYWINGTDADGNPVTENYGAQISYTLKYFPDVVSFDEFKMMLLQYQPQIKCCAVMPVESNSGYEYLPEEMISHEEYEAIVAKISGFDIAEDIGVEHVDCASGGCPIDFKSEQKA